MEKFYFLFFTYLCNFKRDLLFKWEKFHSLLFSCRIASFSVGVVNYWNILRIEYIANRFEPVWKVQKIARTLRKINRTLSSELSTKQIRILNSLFAVYFCCLNFLVYATKTRATSDNTLHVMCIRSMQLLVFWSSSGPFYKILLSQISSTGTCTGAFSF